jgi:vitamin K-dependent gamma-carboxylase
MFDPRVDLLGIEWSPFEEVTWLMPLLKQFSPWRKTIKQLQDHVHSWSNQSDALFVADFPGKAFKMFTNNVNAFLNTCKVRRGF